MAAHYIADLFHHLGEGKLSDVRVVCGEKEWQVHRLIVSCHSAWFRKALSGGFHEASNAIINLEEDEDFDEALECMMSYFYQAEYDFDQYETPKALLHARVAAISDKYDCPSLHKLASTRFGQSLKNMNDDGLWIQSARVVYRSTTATNAAHKVLRQIIIDAFVSRHHLQESILKNGDAAALFYGEPDLATDLLLSASHQPKHTGGVRQVFMCVSCCYVHIGHPDCQSLLHGDWIKTKGCPKCRRSCGSSSRKKWINGTVLMHDTVACEPCGGEQTI